MRHCIVGLDLRDSRGVVIGSWEFSDPSFATPSANSSTAPLLLSKLVHYQQASLSRTMGTVHGVYLKYVGLSALSYMGYTMFAGKEANAITHRDLQAVGQSLLPITHHGWIAAALGYSALVNGVIAVLFKAEIGMGIIGKDRATGQIPLWSKLIFFPFHLPTRLYTYIHTEQHLPAVPVASEVQDGWWVGGCYANRLGKHWGAVIDLTVEFPEAAETDHYLSLPTWDGVPATPAQLENAAAFAVNSPAPRLIHCAHGRGRSTTTLCACLVKAGLFPTWQEAFEKGIKPYRSVCKLNRRMRQNLQAWQEEYVDQKKGH